MNWYAAEEVKQAALVHSEQSHNRPTQKTFSRKIQSISYRHLVLCTD